MNRQARVVVAYATVKLNDPATGKPTVRGFYRDAVLPDFADADNVASLVRRGYAEWVDEPEEPPAELPAEQPTEEPAAAPQPPAEPAAEEPKPRKAAAKTAG